MSDSRGNARPSAVKLLFMKKNKIVSTTFKDDRGSTIKWEESPLQDEKRYYVSATMKRPYGSISDWWSTNIPPSEKAALRYLRTK